MSRHKLDLEDKMWNCYFLFFFLTVLLSLVFLVAAIVYRVVIEVGGLIGQIL